MINEAILSRSEIAKYDWRIQKFIRFVRKSEKFLTTSGWKVIRISIFDKDAGEFIEEVGTLSSEQEEQAFIEWLKGSKQYNVRLIWDGDFRPWSSLIKDEFNFKKENSTNQISQVREKQFTPSALGLAGKKFTFSAGPISFVTYIARKSSGNLRDTLFDFLSCAFNSTGLISSEFSQETKDYLKFLNEADKRILIKDFGEIVSAIIACKKYNFSQIQFPSNINAPLIDFYIDGHAFSVKSLKGSATSLKSFAAFYENEKFISSLNTAEKEAIEILIHANNLSLHDSALYFSKYFAKNDAKIRHVLTAIKVTLGISDVTSENIVNAAAGDLEKVNQFYAMNVGLVPRSDLSTRNITDSIIKSLFIYPLIKLVIENLNAPNSIFKSIIAKSINTQYAISQIKCNFDNLTAPTHIQCKIIQFDSVKTDNVEFSSKAYTTSFEKGGIGIKLNESNRKYNQFDTFCFTIHESQKMQLPIIPTSSNY